jgi:DNA-binding transcriptional MerR regulator
MFIKSISDDGSAQGGEIDAISTNGDAVGLLTIANASAGSGNRAAYGYDTTVKAREYGWGVGYNCNVYNNYPASGNYNFGLRATVTGATNNYGVWASADKNYFSGNVGIGQANPTGKLQVEGGQVAFGGAPYSAFNTTVRGDYNLTALDNAGNLSLSLYAGVAPCGLRVMKLFNSTCIWAYSDGGSTRKINLDGGTGMASFGSIISGNLAGSGNRFVYVGPGGDLQPGVAYPGLLSDLRLKKNIEPISTKIDVLKAISKIRGVYFNWNNDIEAAKDLGTQKEIGVIAQEIEPYLPELVSTDKDGYKGFDYPRLSVFLVEVCRAQEGSIEAQQKEIETQQKQLDEQKKINEDMKARLDKLEEKLAPAVGR